MKAIWSIKSRFWMSILMVRAQRPLKKIRLPNLKSLALKKFLQCYKLLTSPIRWWSRIFWSLKTWSVKKTFRSSKEIWKKSFLSMASLKIYLSHDLRTWSKDSVKSLKSLKLINLQTQTPSRAQNQVQSPFPHLKIQSLKIKMGSMRTVKMAK